GNCKPCHPEFHVADSKTCIAAMVGDTDILGQQTIKRFRPGRTARATAWHASAKLPADRGKRAIQGCHLHQKRSHALQTTRQSVHLPAPLQGQGTLGLWWPTRQTECLRPLNGSVRSGRYTPPAHEADHWVKTPAMPA